MRMAEFYVENCHFMDVHCDESVEINMAESCMNDNQIMVAPCVDLFWIEKVNFNSSRFGLIGIRILMLKTTLFNSRTGIMLTVVF